MLKIGHRGAAGHAPENTLASFAKALELGVDMIELDVRKCATGEIVVIHFRTVDKITDGHGWVFRKTFTELRSLDAGGGERIPLLEEVLDLVDGKVPVDIELKGFGTAEPVASIVRSRIKKPSYNERSFLVSSSRYAELATFHRLLPSINIAAIIRRWAPAIYREWFMWRLPLYALCPHFKKVTARFVARAHKKGLKVFPYPVNNPADIARMKRLGVDGIFSDYPDRL